MSQRNRFLGRLRLVLVYLFVGGLVAVSRPTPAFVWAGAAVVGLGEAVRLWAAGHLVKSVTLITSGPYAHTQNPLYLGRLLILTGLAIAARVDWYLNLLLLAIGYGIFFLYYMPRKIRVEGNRLARLHGPAFEAYRNRVPILLPSFRRYAGDGARWSFRLMVHNQEPFVLAGLIVVIGFLAWKGLRS